MTRMLNTRNPGQDTAREYALNLAGNGPRNSSKRDPFRDTNHPRFVHTRFLPPSGVSTVDVTDHPDFSFSTFVKLTRTKWKTNRKPSPPLSPPPRSLTNAPGIYNVLAKRFAAAH